MKKLTLGICILVALSIPLMAQSNKKKWSGSKEEMAIVDDLYGQIIILEKPEFGPFEKADNTDSQNTVDNMLSKLITIEKHIDSISFKRLFRARYADQVAEGVERIRQFRIELETWKEMNRLSDSSIPIDSFGKSRVKLCNCKDTKANYKSSSGLTDDMNDIVSTYYSDLKGKICCISDNVETGQHHTETALIKLVSNQKAIYEDNQFRSIYLYRMREYAQLLRAYKQFHEWTIRMQKTDKGK